MRVCAQPSCPELLDTGRWCPAHQPRRGKEYRSPQSTERQKHYKTARWRNFSKAYRQAHPDCVWCGAPAEHVDHLDGQGPAGPRGYDDNNLASVCQSCHSRKTAHADGSFGRPRLPRP